MAIRLAERKNSNELLAHLGADEYAVLISHVDVMEINHLVSNYADIFSQSFQLGNLSLTVHVSIGVATFPEHGESIETLLQKADIALNQCKFLHASHVVFESSMDKFSLQRLNLMSDLKLAINEDQLTVFFQPKINLQDRAVVSAEALIRWNHPVHGFVRPDEFIPLAEQTGVIRDLTKWVLQRVLTNASSWSETVNITIAVNISALDLTNIKLPLYVKRLMHEKNWPAASLMLEVTESALMSDPDSAMKALTLLKEMGVRLSIDDFGTGYSSMEKLKRMPVDELKIDRSFVMDIVDSEDDQAIVKTIISLAHNLNLKVVAEGVETNAVATLLAEYHCDVAQGYFYSRPLAEEDFLTWYHDYQRKLSESPTNMLSL